MRRMSLLGGIEGAAIESRDSRSGPLLSAEAFWREISEWDRERGGNNSTICLLFFRSVQAVMLKYCSVGRHSTH